MTPLRGLTYSLLLAASALPAAAQQAATGRAEMPVDRQQWSYAECVAYARTHNISLRQSRLDQRRALVDLSEAKGALLPSLNLYTNQGYVNTPFGTDAHNAYNSDYRAEGEWLAWNGGRRRNTVTRNLKRSDMLSLATDDLMRSLETEILRFYLRITYAKQAVGIYRSAVALSRAQMENARELLDLGRMNEVDFAQLNSQYEQDRYNLVNSQAVYDQTRMQLKQLLELGIDVQIELDSVDWDSDRILAELPAMSESLELAKAIDLQLRMLDIDKEVNVLDIKIAQASKKPEVTLHATAGTAWHTPGLHPGTGLKRGLYEELGASLRFPVFDRRKTESATARARLQEENTALQIEKRETDLAQLIENAYIDTRAAQARYAAAQAQLKSAELTDDLTNRRFRKGYIAPLELLASHSGLTEARRNLLEAKFLAIYGRLLIDFYRTATVSL